jgi:hypothetical protein
MTSTEVVVLTDFEVYLSDLNSSTVLLDVKTEPVLEVTESLDFAICSNYFFTLYIL